MERIQKFQCFAAEKIQERQIALDGKGYGRLSIGTAGFVMLFVFCPMSIVAVACPYWTLSSEVQGHSMTAKASLWDVSTSAEIGGVSSEAEVGMCGDEMQGFDDCGKIDAIRFFVITALLLSLASAVCLIAVFLRLKPTAIQRKVTLAGITLAAVVFLLSFLSVCVASSVNMQEGYSLNGAGFAFLVLQMFFVASANALAVWELRYKSKSSRAAEANCQEDKKEQSQVTQDVPPTLLSMVGKPQDRDLKKDDAAKNVEAAAIAENKRRMLEATAKNVGLTEKTSSEDKVPQPAISKMHEQQPTEEPHKNSPRERQSPLPSMFERAAAPETAPAETYEATIQLQSPRPEQRYVCACPGM